MRNIFAVLFSLWPMLAFGQVQLVDISTLTTNRITNTVLGIGITIPSAGITNAPYTTVNTNALQIGDTPYNAFVKVNANATLLAGLTNALRTNGATANGQTIFRTNAAQGYFWAAPTPAGTNFISTNGATANGQTLYRTNSGNGWFWAAAPTSSGGIASLSATNNGVIFMFDSLGQFWLSNTVTANSALFNTNQNFVLSSNLSVGGQTWLNNSNVIIYKSLGSDYYTNSFTITTNGDYHGVGFPSGYPNGVYTIAYGETYNGHTPIYTNLNGIGVDTIYYVTNNSNPGYPTGSSIWIWKNAYAYANNFPFVWYYYYGTTAIATGVYNSYYPIQLIESASALEILSTNGVSINTNSAAGYALNIHGGVNVDDNYYIKGVPISGMSISNSYRWISFGRKLYVTNCAGVATNYNGFYDDTGLGYLTNENSAGWQIGIPGNYFTAYDVSNTLYGTASGWYMTTNIHYHPGVPSYINTTSLFGYYQLGPYSGSSPTNQPNATQAGSWLFGLPLPGVFATNGIATLISNQVAPNSITFTGSPFSWTNTQAVNVQVGWSGGVVSAFTVNGGNWFGGSVTLQPTEWATWTYTVAPSAAWKPF